MGRPTKALIEYDRVIKEALRIVHIDGEDGLSMRTLAKRIGVNPASIYHHFKNKEEIVEAVCEYIAAKVRPTQIIADTWEETLLRLAEFYRLQTVAYPNASRLMFDHSQGVTRSRYHSLYEEVLESLSAAGFSLEKALIALIGIEVIASGSALAEITMHNKIDFGMISEEDFPLLSNVTKKMHITARDSFIEVLQLFVDGLAAGLSKPQEKALPDRKRASR